MYTNKYIQYYSKGGTGALNEFAKEVIANIKDGVHVKRNVDYAVTYELKAIPDIEIRTSGGKIILVFCVRHLQPRFRTKIVGIAKYKRKLINAGDTSILNKNAPSVRLLLENANYLLDNKNPNGMTYGDWATKQGFIWAEGDDVPYSWIYEE